MDLLKQLQDLVDQTLRLFGEHILPGYYQPGEKFACQQFIVHSFDSVMPEL